MDFQQRNQISQHDLAKKPNWNTCIYCRGMRFKELHDFTRHLRTEHCIVEGGSFVCQYGYNAVCNSLPLEGVSDLDYADHILKNHAFSSSSTGMNSTRRKQSQSSDSSLNSLSSNWTMVSASQNLAAVLNDPGRGKQKDFFTKLWGVDFVEASLASVPPNPHLPVITRAHFETYLKKISKRHRRHEQLNQGLVTQNVSSARRVRHRSFENQALDIPPIFLQQDFDLSKPATFYIAFPFAKNGISVDSSFRQSGKLLQEKLTQGLDQVEMRIAEQVAEKSEAFFQAMASHDTLMEHLGKTLSNVRCLRGKIKTVESGMTSQALHLLQLHQRRNNYHLVLQKLKLMRTVHQTQPQIQVLLSAPDYVAALELILTSRDILDHELVSVHSFRHLGPQLSEINRLIDMMMTTEFESYSTRDLNRPLHDDIDVLEQEKLVCIMLGMLRRGNIEFITKYQTEGFTALRALVKQVVLECLADCDCEAQGPYAAEQVSKLNLSQFIPLMETLTAQCLRLLKKIKGVHDVMKETLEMAAGLGKGGETEGDGFGFLPSKELEKGRADLQKLLSAVCNFANEECAKLLNNVGALENASASQVCRLGQVVEQFTQDCSAVCGKGSSPLRVAFQVQASKFVTKFHVDRKERLTIALESESWRATEVPPAIQQFVCTVSASDSIPDIPELPGKGENFLLVDNEKYLVIGAVLVVIRLISEYSVVARDLSLLTLNLLRNMAELLSVFNSRSCQLVLGAGALQSAGLKTITTTNLLLTSRALQLLIWFLPHIKKHFEGVLAGSSLKGSKSSGGILLDDVETNMLDHIDQLHAKFVLIGSRAVADELLGWAAKPPVPSKAFRNIYRHMFKLNDAVSGVLPSKQIEELFRKINDAFKSALREQLKKLHIVNNGGPQHGNVTSELIFYVDMLKKLDVLPNEDLSDSSLEEIWKSR